MLEFLGVFLKTIWGLVEKVIQYRPFGADISACLPSNCNPRLSGVDGCCGVSVR